MFVCPQHGSRHKTLVGYETCSYSSTYYLNPERAPEPHSIFRSYRKLHRSVHAWQIDGVAQPHLHSLDIVHNYSHYGKRNGRGHNLANKNNPEIKRCHILAVKSVAQYTHTGSQLQKDTKEQEQARIVDLRVVSGDGPRIYGHRESAG